MSLEQDSLRGVVVNYGGRAPGRSAGVVKTEGASNEVLINLTGQMLSDGFVIDLTIPSGASFTGKATLIVEEAFDLAASSVVEVGEDSLESTNGVSLTEANLESTGVKDVSTGLAGEWAAGSQLPHDQDVGIAFSAGSVTDATVGKAKLVLVYDKV